ncbi:hypothetical protein LRS74_25730 [Streptomyces sp. LX-29]|uniref:hypothetical protein n=1 Tax=Streptomyces sp. LX-29 TaxID=2900152 RepID=UPI00240E3388|nr:hypothetical protein [Streptomyces sp. LX-29]WFB10061.1 hypothetical protein LRS74_25730 [Streptomyces sp. LX-29]
MTFPPPPNQPDPSANGGGFGPPQQGFGPPVSPGTPQAAPQGGFGAFGPSGSGPGGPTPGGPGPYGPVPPGPGGPGSFGPPPPPARRGRKLALVGGAAAAVALIAGGVVVAMTGDDDDGDKKAAQGTPGATTGSAAPTPSAGPSSSSAAPSPSGAEDPGKGAPVGGGADTPGGSPSPSSSASPSDLVPYVVLKPGQCFDHPGLSSDVTKVEIRSCDSPHDGEVIANETLTGAFATDKEIQDKALALCRVDAEKRMKSIPRNSSTYYYYALYPARATYTFQGSNQVSCSLTLSGKVDGPKLSKPLPG